jgi:tRNA threonylcarbamoyladenosine biosynthesis protein TsaB
MRVLAVDTTTARGSVAVVEGDALRGESRLDSPEGHSPRLLPAIASLLESLRLGPEDVEGYAVTLGPGSFTGLRVGISTVQGLALASGRSCIGLPALDVLAALIAGTADTLVAMIDAYRDEVYTGVYDRAGRLVSPRRVASPERAIEGVSGAAAFVGDGAERHRERIAARCPGAVFPARDPFIAGMLGRLAAPRLAAGEGVEPEALRPLYLREADVRKSAP